MSADIGILDSGSAKAERSEAGDGQRKDGFEKAGGSVVALNPEARLPHSAGDAVADYLKQHESKSLCLLYTSPSPRDVEESRMPSSA